MHALVASAAVVVVALTGFAQEHRSLLAHATQESGPFELGGALALTLLSAYSVRVLLRERAERALRPSVRLAVAAMAVLGLLAALEELSFGQHILGFESGDFFLEHNRQQEMNLHNLLPPLLFNGLIDTGPYIAFVYLPLFLLLRPPRGRIEAWVRAGFPPFTGSVHNVLIFCFGFSLQAYFEPLAITDTIALGTSYALLAAVFWRAPKLRTRAHLLHFALVLAATAFFVSQHRLFEFANMQYEIRECVFTYALLHFYVLWIEQRRAPGTSAAAGSGEVAYPA
ncbi:MAG: hypothetical protein AAF682_04670 [Planctomycetota bacterium]